MASYLYLDLALIELLQKIFQLVRVRTDLSNWKTRALEKCLKRELH